MADPSQLYQQSFAAGLDESQQAEVQDPAAAFRILENVRQESPGAIEKRYGFATLNTTRVGLSNRLAGRRLFAHEGAPMVIDGSTLDSYIAAAQTNVSRGRVPECTYSLKGARAPSASAVLYDTATCNGYVALSYAVVAATLPTSTGQIIHYVVEADTGEFVLEQVSGVTNGYALLASLSNRYIVRFEYNVATTAITWSFLDTTNLAAGWSVAASVVAAAVTSFAVCSLTDRVAIAYGTTSGTDRVTVKTYNQTGLLETRTIATASTTPTLIAMNGSIADTLWVAWDQGANMRAIGIDADLLATTRASAATIITIGAAYVDLDICEGATAGSARVWATTDAIPVQLITNDITTVAGAATPGTSNTVRNVCPTSRSFQTGGRYYMACFPAAAAPFLVASTANSQALCVIVDWTDNVSYVRPVANIEPGLVAATTSKGKFSALAAGQYVYGLQITTSGGIGIGAAVSQSSTLSTLLLDLDFIAGDRWLTASHAGNTFIGGALLTVYDGARLTEAGFLARPTKPSASVGGTGITGTNYRAVAVYEDIDASGNWVPSGVSEPSNTRSAANQTITWSTLTLGASYRLTSSSMRVAWYRTLTGGEPPYYRLGVSTHTAGTATSTFADAVADVDLATHSLLNGDGNLPATDTDNDGQSSAQDRRAPPGLTRLVSYEGMLVGSRGSGYFHSGQTVGGEATWFSPVFQGTVDDDIEAFAAQDGALYMFTRRAIYVAAGSAPSDNGLQGGLGQPRRLAVDVGASQWPTCVTSLGVFFVSDRGVELLTRAQTVEYVGEKVKETFAAFPTVRAMTFDSESSCVLIELTSAVAGRTVVFDTRSKQWQSVDRRTNAFAFDPPARDGCLVWNGSAWRYAWLGQEGQVYVEDHATHLDPGGTWITMRAQTPWVKLAGIQGYQQIDRALLLAEKATDHNLTISLGHDYAPSFVQTRAYTRAQINALTREQLEVPTGNNARGQAIRVKLEDATPTGGTVGIGQGAKWVALTFEGIVDRSRARLSAGAR